MTTSRGLLLSVSAFGLFMQTPLCSPTDLAGTAGMDFAQAFLAGGQASPVGSTIGFPGGVNVSGGAKLGAWTVSASLAAEGGSTGVCCEVGGACGIYGGNECPSGTTQVSCPCRQAATN